MRVLWGFLLVVLAAAVVSSSANAFLVRECNTHYLYSVESDEYNLTALQPIKLLSGKHIAGWNENGVFIYNGSWKTIPVSDMQKAFSYKGWIIALGDEIEVINESSESAVLSVPMNGTLEDYYFFNNAVALGFDNACVLVNLTTGDYKILTQGCDHIATDGEILFVSLKDTVYAWNGEFLWNITLGNEITDLMWFHNTLYALKLHSLTEIKNGAVVSNETTGGMSIFGIGDKIVLEKFLIDDEGKKMWLFSFYTDNFTHLFTQIVFLEPKVIGFWNDSLLVFDGKYTHILNESHFMWRSDYSYAAVMNDYVIYTNGTVIHAMSLKWEVIDSGIDRDDDWIMDKYDPDDDNDGMPDWWEEKYGLNPDDPTDANKDPDHDGLTNYQEYLHGTDPHKWDTDGDGLSDGYEVAIGTDPTVPNSTFTESQEITTIVSAAFLILFLAAAIASNTRAGKK